MGEGRRKLDTRPNEGWTLISWWPPWPETWDTCELLSQRSSHNASVSWEHLHDTLHSTDVFLTPTLCYYLSVCVFVGGLRHYSCILTGSQDTL